jgi:hypothetical protein
LTGLVAVRITWITAILVCGVAILVELFSGTSGGSASRQLPGFAFSAGRDSSQRLPKFSSVDPAAAMAGGAAPDGRSGRAKQKPPGSHSGSRIPPRSGNQPVDTGGRKPVVTPRPKPPRAPQGDLGKTPPAPSVTPPEAPKPPKEPSTPVAKPPKPLEEPLVEPPKPPKPPKEPSVDPPDPAEEPLPEPPKPSKP